MKNFHVNSAESTKINRYVLAQKNISIHYATDVLRLKLLDEPIAEIKSSIVQDDLKPLEIIILKMGGFIFI
ncbi:MAG TPA: hypothetical protein QGF51_06710 [Candidatus Marinimicrobia bacterium]|jgi:hypothetical protein|nr:hypothetical protein [Candidatus Neomarinimicrobiota bacterium]|tara:strand:- start:3097 stop:3309 length:213 start_codon:yes stop_codon:yes gene_type:complete